MIIKTKKCGEFEIGESEQISKALSDALGPVLDEMYDIVVVATTITMWPDEDLTICVAIGGDDVDELDLKTITLQTLITDAMTSANVEEREDAKRKLIEIAASI